MDKYCSKELADKKGVALSSFHLVYACVGDPRKSQLDMYQRV